MENLDFMVHVYGSFSLFGQEILITSTLVFTWAICLFVILFSIFTNLYMKKFNQIPKGFQNFIEFVVGTFDNFATGIVGKKYSPLGFWYFGVFVFIILSNLSGLIGFRSPTADISITLGFGLTTFFLIHILGITQSKGEYFKGYLEPFPVFLPLNIIGEFATPISLSFRLFGNILGGLVIMSMIYCALPVVLRLFVPAPLHIYFDVFSGVLQTYIFCILSLTFISSKLPQQD